MGMSDELGGIAILALVGFGLYSVFSPNDAEYFTAYEGVCWAPSPSIALIDWSKCGSTQDSRRSVNEVTFRVDPERQRVFELGAFIQRYDDCVVANTENWRCREGAVSIIEVSNGVLFRHSAHFGARQPLGYLEYQMFRWRFKK